MDSMNFLSIEHICYRLMVWIFIARTDLLLIDSMDFVAKKCKYRIFDAKICKYSLIDSFLRIVAVSDNAAN